jgi:signal transduction histidine kinase
MRSRLILLVGATSSLVVIAFLAPLAVLVRSTAADRALSSAIVEAQTLAPTVATVDGPQLAAAVAQTNATSAHQFTVFLPDGTVVGAPSPRTAAVSEAQTGRSVIADTDGGDEVTVAVSGLPGPGGGTGTAVVRTFVPDAELTAGVARSWLVLVLLGVGLLLVCLLVADRLARRLTRPLSAVAGVSHQLAGGDLDARAGTDGPPEVRQVSAGLNLLANRITELLAQERATVADISHRLRTPLTVLRIDVESLTDAEARVRLVADLDAVDRTVDDVIREAERPARGEVASCDAARVVTDRIGFWRVVAEEQRRKVAVSVVDEPAPVKASRADLAACVDALVGNVFMHTPVGTALSVSLHRRPGGGACLVVSDDGPGMPEGPVLRRGNSGAGSTGLGLDIVARTATRSGGGVWAGRSWSGGAEVRVDLGPPDPLVL